MKRGGGGEKRKGRMNEREVRNGNGGKTKGREDVGVHTIHSDTKEKKGKLNTWWSVLDLALFLTVG